MEVMADEKRSDAAEAQGSFEKTTETLSQFIARVLNQLSLSTWLPSAALVLFLTFVFELGAVLDSTQPKDKGPGDALSRAFDHMAHIKLGGAILLFSCIVVLTIFTQAFSFEAIRALEGYWGTIQPIEWVAKIRATRFRRQGSRLRARERSLRRRSWLEARVAIEAAQAEAIESHKERSEIRKWTADMLTYRGGIELGQKTDVTLSPAQMKVTLTIPWRTFAPTDLIRRLVNVDRRLRDFPTEHRTLPTRLGNILRTHEDQTQRRYVETFILEIEDSIPPALRSHHFDHRNRLDLYCSMVFVAGLLTAIAALRLGFSDWPYAAVSAVVGLMLMWLFYRAALSTARVYGAIIVAIARKVPQPAT
jgi:hypothetical protein